MVFVYDIILILNIKLEEENMSFEPCCICGKNGEKIIGRRWFCAEHYESATHERKGSWRSIIALVVVLVVFVVAVYALDAAIKPVFTGTTLVLTGIMLALVPAAIWLAFFYQQDRLEPEPVGYVLGVFALGALLAAAVGIPLLDKVFRVGNWLYADTLTTILGSILVVGFTQEFLKYAAVRFSLYNSAEFDEPTDGIIYATAAGLGYATVLNIQFVVANGGVNLGAGVIAMAVVALAQASFAGITGYFLGRAKFEADPIWWMPLGVTLAAIANGLFNWLRGLITRGGISLSGSTGNSWLGLILAALVAAAILGLLLWLIRRNIKSALAAK
jgi:RsiW-degrading membrane proteinase PrsW (M82 family)